MFHSTYGRSFLPLQEVILHPRFIRAQYGRLSRWIYRGSLFSPPETLPSARGLAPCSARDSLVGLRNRILSRWMNVPLMDIRLPAISCLRDRSRLIGPRLESDGCVRPRRGSSLLSDLVGLAGRKVSIHGSSPLCPRRYPRRGGEG